LARPQRLAAIAISLLWAHARAALAYVFGFRWLGLSGLQALLVFEALCAAISLVLVGRLVRMWGGKRSAALAAQLVLMCSLAFWRLASGGEERIAALASQLAFLAAFWGALSTGRGGWLVASTLAVAILVHLENLVLVPFAAVALLFLPSSWLSHRRHVAGRWLWERSLQGSCSPAWPR
jgi:uncharacterized membrane protein YhfC